MAGRLLIFGLGYTGNATARLALARGWAVAATSREPSRVPAPPAGLDLVRFAAAAAEVARATHLLMSAAPDEAGDPALAAHGEAIREAATRGTLRWAGYLSTTGVYGDRQGGWVDEATAPAPGQARSRRRLAAEAEWAALAPGIAVELFRTAGIYGAGRSALGEARAGRARQVIKPGHAFGRIHVDDIARAVLAAAGQGRAPGLRVLHLVDDEPAEPAAVAIEAARLLGLPPPPEVPFAEAYARMGEMARSFWDESRRVGNAATKRALGLAWTYPTYREGLRAILEAEGG